MHVMHVNAVVLEAAVDFGTTPFDVQDIVDYCTLRGLVVDRGTVARSVSRLVANGQLIRIGRLARGKHTATFHHIHRSHHEQP